MNIEELMKYRNETVRKIAGMEELVWINPKEMDYSEYEKNLPVSDEELKDAEERLARFAPFIKKVFPETAETNGIIESPLEPIFSMQKELEKIYETEIPGKLYLKMDSHLPVAGSVKARGGVYDVLKHAEELAMEAGMLSVTDEDVYKRQGCSCLCIYNSKNIPARRGSFSCYACSRSIKTISDRRSDSCSYNCYRFS